MERKNKIDIEEIIKKHKLENHPHKEELAKLILEQEKDEKKNVVFLRSKHYYLQEFDKAIEQSPNLVDIKNLKLTYLEKSILYLNFWASMKLTEIAEELSIPLRKIKYLKENALRKLGKKVK